MSDTPPTYKVTAQLAASVRQLVAYMACFPQAHWEAVTPEQN